MKQGTIPTSPQPSAAHVLEHNRDAQEYFGKISRYPANNACVAFRHAVAACTGSLPTWAQPKKGGRKVSALERPRKPQGHGVASGKATETRRDA